MLLRSLGEALLAVLEAEANALRTDLAESGRRFAVVLALAATAAFLLFWSIWAAGLALYQILSLWLPSWAAALILLAVLLLLASIFGGLARYRLGQIEPPVDTVRRRVDDHRNWWHEELLSDLDSGRGPARIDAGEGESE